MTAGTGRAPRRPLGPSGIDVSAVGLGCWAIGGPAYRDGKAIGWGEVDDDESVAAIHAGIEAGVKFFDTAKRLWHRPQRTRARPCTEGSRRHRGATKIGNLFYEASRTATGRDASAWSVRQQCEASLRRLNRDVIDLYQFHIGDYDPVAAEEVLAVLEDLVDEGKIRCFGWSTDDPRRVAVFARSAHCAAIQFAFNVLDGSSPVLDVCESHGLAGILRGPLAKGALSGNSPPGPPSPPTASATSWTTAGRRRSGRRRGGGPRPARLKRPHRGPGALCWLLARSNVLVPIPGFRTVEQARENAAAMSHGPFSADEMAQVRQVLEPHART